jgi:hypothetical protein
MQADRADRARPVLDDDRLPEGRGEAFAYEAGDSIGR